MQPPRTPQGHTRRPSLFTVAPLTASICWIFGGVNLIVGLALYFLYEPTVPILVVNDIFTFDVWGGMFILVGVFGIYALLANDWRLIRRMLLVGLVAKATWFVALVIRCITSPKSTVLLTAIWLLFALVQAATYIFFDVTTGPRDEQLK